MHSFNMLIQVAFFQASLVTVLTWKSSITFTFFHSVPGGPWGKPICASLVLSLDPSRGRDQYNIDPLCITDIILDWVLLAFSEGLERKVYGMALFILVLPCCIGHHYHF